MPSNIDPTRPAQDVPASKADLRANLQAAKDEIEALQDAASPGISTTAAPTISVQASSFGDRQYIKLLCSATSAITITLEANVPAGKAVELVRYGATGNITARAGTGATLVKPSSASHSTTEQYEALVYEVDTNSGTNAAWRLVARP